MFGLGMGELIVILIVALLFVGPEKLPELARSVGKGIRDLRRHTRDLQETIEQDETLGGTVRELRQRQWMIGSCRLPSTSGTSASACGTR